MPTLHWIGKDAVVNHHKEVPFRLLKPVEKLIGQVWEEKSNGQCLFIIPKGPDWNAILGKLGG